MPKQTITLRVDPDLLEKFRNVAGVGGNFSAAVDEGLRWWIEKEKRARRTADIAQPKEIVAAGIGGRTFHRVRRRPDGRWLIETLGRHKNGQRRWRVVSAWESRADALRMFSRTAPRPLPEGVSLPDDIVSEPWRAPSEDKL